MISQNKLDNSNFWKLIYKKDVPGWCLLFCSLGLFAYQSLDAIDGKQARRTNSSSPLGELFDHGCDAVSTGKYTSFIPNHFSNFRNEHQDQYFSILVIQV